MQTLHIATPIAYLVPVSVCACMCVCVPVEVWHFSLETRKRQRHVAQAFDVGEAHPAVNMQCILPQAEERGISGKGDKGAARGPKIYCIN